MGTISRRDATRQGRCGVGARLAAGALGIVTGLLASAVAPATVLAQTSGTPTQSSAPKISESGKTTLLVKVAAGLSADDEKALIQRGGGTRRGAVGALRIIAVDVPAAEVGGAMTRYKGDSKVERVETSVHRKAAGAATDPEYAKQWALPKIGWDQVHGVVDVKGSSTIAVLDTGVDSGHADIVSRLVEGYTAFTGNGSAANIDPNGHGTWMASIAAAMTDNDKGIAGVAYAGTSIMPVRVLGPDGTGEDADIINGLVWAADHGANVILMGFSNPGFSQALQDAVEYAWSKGAVLVAATGNDGSSTPTYPAGDAKVVGVSATDQNDALWSGSNYGTDTFLAAPGVGILADALGGGLRRSPAPPPPPPWSPVPPPCCVRTTLPPRTAPSSAAWPAPLIPRGRRVRPGMAA